MISANPDEKFHASAPVGMKCADCSMGGADPCPRCYLVWWRRRHPNVMFAPDVFAADVGTREPGLPDPLKVLREKFDALLIAEVKAYGGVPEFRGPCERENMELREAIAGALQGTREPETKE